jgi:rRNA-processing protein FCF1
LPKTVLLDTNFLLAPHRFHVDIFSETEATLKDKVEFVVTSTVIDEINRLIQKSNPKFQKELRFAKTIAKQCKILDVVLEPGESVDDNILRVAIENQYIVATSDIIFRRKLRKAGVRTLVLRQKRYIELLY